MLADNQVVYTRNRRRFGRQCLFVDRTQQMLSVNPNSRLRLLYILRDPVDRGTQLANIMGADTMETINVVFGNHGMYHHEGGWPKEINIFDEEATLRHRKKIERDDVWGLQVMTLIDKTTSVINQNNVGNIYLSYFEDLPEMNDNILDIFGARTMNVFHDLYLPHRSVLFIDWAPGENHNFLVQHYKVKGIIKERNFYNPPEVGSVYSFYVWDVKDSVKPVTIFESPDPVCKAMHCQKDETHLAGCCYNGEVCIWIARDGGMPIKTCPLESAHREKGSALCWVHSKSNTEFYTGSLDGSIKFWDKRNLTHPTQEVLADPEGFEEQRRSRAHGVTVLEFEYTIPVRFIMGSDLGYVFIGNRKGVTPTDILLANYKIMSGPIRTIERNPFFVKIFIIAGDWCAKVWTEEHKNSPMSMIFKKKHQVTCASWSTLRSSLFVTGSLNGELDFYDLLLDQLKPLFTMRFKQPITHTKFRPDGEVLGVSFKNGDVFLLELDDAMKYGTSKDKALVAALFEREQQRTNLLEGRFEEVKLKDPAKSENAEERADGKGEAALVLHLNDPEKFLQMIESDEEFKEALNNFHTILSNVEAQHQSREYIMECTEFEKLHFEEEENLEVPLPQ